MMSLVVPAYNEGAGLPDLIQELETVVGTALLDVEFLIVDDGSSDDTWNVVRAWAERNPRVHGIRLRRNFGKTAALAAGFQAARGDLIITLDADLQDDPAEIPRLLAEIHRGLDVVNGWKRVRHDPWHKVIPSRWFNRLVSLLTGVRLHDHNCGLKVLRAEVVRELRLYGELHRFIPVLAHARGFRVGEVEVRHRPRRFGISKYGARRFVKGFLDLLTVTFVVGFSQRPAHLLGTLGLLSFSAGGLGLLYLLGTWIARQLGIGSFEPLMNRPLLLYSVAALLLGAQMLSLGIVAELLVHARGRDHDLYSVAERVGERP